MNCWDVKEYLILQCACEECLDVVWNVGTSEANSGW
jgi:hypothetical protein